jgi:hypothetical protein
VAATELAVVDPNSLDTNSAKADCNGLDRWRARLMTKRGQQLSIIEPHGLFPETPHLKQLTYRFVERRDKAENGPGQTLHFQSRPANSLRDRRCHCRAVQVPMSATDLRNYMAEIQMAKASKSFEGMDRAEKARHDLIKRLAEPLDPTPARLKEILQPLRAKLRSAAEGGQTELMVIRFPNVLCCAHFGTIWFLPAATPLPRPQHPR